MSTPEITELETPCLEWTGSTNGAGYGKRTIGGGGRGRGKGKGKSVYVHRWAVAQILGWEAIKGKIVMHRCDNPICYRYSHLVVGTMKDNQADMATKGRAASGERNGQAKLTEAEVLAIYNAEGGQSEIGRRLGVSNKAVHEIKRGKRWSTVTGANR